MNRLALAIIVCAGCATDFEDPSIVLDLRVLGVRAAPPEVVLPIDIDDPFALAAIEIPDVEVCALVADPGQSRTLRFDVAVCAPTRSGRCDDPEATRYALGAGQMSDPDETADELLACAAIPGDARLWDVLGEAVRADSLAGFGGIAVQVEISVGPSAASERVFATKRVLYSPQIPESRVANENPELLGLSVDGKTPRAGRCADPETVGVEVLPGQTIEIFPLEASGARELYVLPTFDGGEREFVENIAYAWFAGDGQWSAETTGGPIDGFGNEPALQTTWTAPETLEAGDAIDVRVVARDERGGAVWNSICVRHQQEVQ